MFRAIDVGYGSVKGVSMNKEIEYPSALGKFRPVRFTSGMEQNDLIDRLCVSYNGKKYYVGNITYVQSTPMATMSNNRFIDNEGMTLMLSSLLLMSDYQAETLNVVTGLPVNEYANLKDKYVDALKGEHHIKLLDFNGDPSKFFAFTIETAKILPQPMGTIFNEILDPYGNLIDPTLAKGRIAVLDIGKYTVDLVLTDGLQFVDKSSISFNDIGLFDTFKDLSLLLKKEGYDIPPDSLEPYVKGKSNLPISKDKIIDVFESQADKIISRVHNIWADIWNFDRIFITGGGSIILGKYLQKMFDSDKVQLCKNPTMTNVRGYSKFAKRKWK